MYLLTITILLTRMDYKHGILVLASIFCICLNSHLFTSVKKPFYCIFPHLALGSNTRLVNYTLLSGTQLPKNYLLYAALGQRTDIVQI